MIDGAVPVPGVDGLWATADGRIVSCKRGEPRIIRGVIYKGYLWVDCGRSSRPRRQGVHQLVAAAFLGPRPAGLVTRHLDGDKLNNVVGNLAYGTQGDNIRDAVRHGTMAFVGEENPVAKLTADQVRQARRDAAAGERKTAIAKRLGVTSQNVCSIVNGRSWKLLDAGG